MYKELNIHEKINVRTYLSAYRHYDKSWRLDPCKRVREGYGSFDEKDPHRLAPYVFNPYWNNSKEHKFAVKF